MKVEIILIVVVLIILFVLIIYKIFKKDTSKDTYIDTSKDTYKIEIIIICDEWQSDRKFASGGNTALYNLCRLINEKKYKNITASLYPFNRVKNYNKICNNYFLSSKIDDKHNTIVIYPDGNEYNPLNSLHVMRWILLEIGTSYRPKDFFLKCLPGILSN